MLDERQQVFKIIDGDDDRFHTAKRLTKIQGWKPVNMSADFSQLAKLPENHPTIRRIHRIAVHYTNKDF